ncbi:hypothetical protein GCM10010449_84860 [Streptomyces rectiviolaceus]|uniref:Nitroreductase family deazaflavin-dependent oxidoreductase n=1 Tax=Streptomyces rectiviolaceus TaxID=332591 RepID=A0ABP6NQ00_9ACTN
MMMVSFEDRRYVVSMLGANANWVRNVRAASGKAVIRRGRDFDVRLHELPVESRAPIMKQYLRAAPGARPHVPVDPDAPLDRFEHIAADFPVFEVSGLPVDSPAAGRTRATQDGELRQHDSGKHHGGAGQLFR